jgi:hypothetical protein
MNLHELADTMAERYGLDPAIFRKQIETESGFQESAVSPVGARGWVRLCLLRLGIRDMVLRRCLLI